MNIVERRPEVAVGFHCRLRAIKPDLSPTPAILPIPIERSAPVQSSDVRKEFRQLTGQRQHMVMIGQNTPGMNFLTTAFESSEQALRKINQSLWIRADDRLMLKTRGGEQITAVLALPMMGTMPGTTIEAPEFEQFFALLFVQFSPEIHRVEVKVGVQPLEFKL
jgi:hypothetical protein